MISMDDSDISHNGTTVCECGFQKTNGATACESCTYLDGRTDTMALVIDSLRGTDGLGIREICEAIYGYHSKDGRRIILRCVQCLEKSGRIRRYLQEGDAAPIPNAFGVQGQIGYSVSSYYAYALNGTRPFGKLEIGDRRIDMDRVGYILKAVSDEFDIPTEMLAMRSNRPGVYISRAIVMMLASECDRTSLAEVAVMLGINDRRGVSRSVLRLRKRLKNDHKLRDRVEKIRKAVTADRQR